MKKFLTITTLAVFSLLTATEPADLAAEALKKVTPGTITMKDPNGWLYSRNELEHLSKGALGNGDVIKKSTAKRNQDPIPALVKFKDDLNALGIQLILVPVPPKAAIHPFTGLQKAEAMRYLKPFYEELRAKGIDVLDLSDAFLKSGNENVYCRTDAHWSSAGIEIAAEEIAKRIEVKGNKSFSGQSSSVKISGDLAKSLNATSPETEEIVLQTVSGAIAKDSPVLLIGDSHTLVFSTGGDMLADNAGLAEALAVKLHTSIDRIGVKGSAATAVRINLFRQGMKDRAWLKNKKVVIYCFSCREFTEATGGWSIVPVTK
ncbi:MAG: hypothetical protein MJ033_06035 [Victivallaceae bacterium]|nr:hypothetical protein [Victivallaceae bacterium]